MAKAATKSKAAPKRAASKATTTMRGKRPAPKAAAKRAAPKPAAKPTRLKAKAPPQRFAVSHLREKDFKRDGLRAYALYRDLGIGDASGGLAQAHVIRLLTPCTDEVRKRHIHDLELQLVYVLKGWIKNEFEGHGEQIMRQGTCWLQPPNIKHTVLDYSEDCEMLEIVVPAEFKTIEV
jgi:hypothetical protein